MATDLSSLISDFGPTLLSAGSSLLQNKLVSDQTKSYNNATANSAGIVNAGLDQQLLQSEIGYDELIKALQQGLSSTSNLTRNAAYDFRGESTKNVDRYAETIKPILNQLLQGMGISNDIFGQNLDKTATETAGTLEDGANLVADKYAPYIESGQNALGYLNNILGLDPNELSPEQARAYSSLSRDLTANLAASGLRGAGRSGVAAVGEGLAGFRANALAQNQARQDQAAQGLNTQGYNATGQVANTIEAMKKAIADLQYKTGTTKASNTFDVNQGIANSAFNAGQDVGNKRYTADTASTANIYNTNRDVANMDNTYNTNLANITAGRYQNRGNTALSKANVNSTAGTTMANANFNLDTQQNQIAADAVNSLLNGITKSNSDSLKKVN